MHELSAASPPTSGTQIQRGSRNTAATAPPSTQPRALRPRTLSPTLIQTRSCPPRAAPSSRPGPHDARTRHEASSHPRPSSAQGGTRPRSGDFPCPALRPLVVPGRFGVTKFTECSSRPSLPPKPVCMQLNPSWAGWPRHGSGLTLLGTLRQLLLAVTGCSPSRPHGLCTAAGARGVPCEPRAQLPTAAPHQHRSQRPTRRRTALPARLALSAAAGASGQLLHTTEKMKCWKTAGVRFRAGTEPRLLRSTRGLNEAAAAPCRRAVPADGQRTGTAPGYPGAAPRSPSNADSASAFPYLPPGPGAGAEREPRRQTPHGPDMLAGLPTAARAQGSHAPQHRESPQPARTFASAEAPVRCPEEKPARGWAPA